MFDTLRATRQTVTFRAVEAIRLPAYAGSTFRGALGFAFRRISCALPRCDCRTCLLRHRCAYSVCFETPVPSDAAIMRKYPYAPHPFVLEPPEWGTRTCEPGEPISLTLCLVGRGIQYLPYFIYAFDELGKGGLGQGRGRAELMSVESNGEGKPQILYDCESQQLHAEPPPENSEDVQARAEALRGRMLRLEFLTPMRVKKNGQFTNDPRMEFLMPSLLRRLHSLDYFHCGGAPDNEVHPLLEAARGVELLQHETRWYDWERYSTRQEASMRLGGFVGHATYAPVPESLLPLLVWGEMLHVGKASAFGLGRYRITPSGEPAAHVPEQA